MNGKELITKMLKQLGIQNWTNQDLATYLDLQHEQYVKFDNRDNTVKLDGWFGIPELEAIITALYMERGSMKG